MKRPVRKTARISGFDYSSTNYYFVTICTHERVCMFGSPHCLNWAGKIAEQEMERIPVHYRGVKIDVFSIMPNHVHAVIVLDRDCMEKAGVTLSQIVGLYKSGVTSRIRKISPGCKVWQRSFHDHVIRNRESYEKIWNYVKYNPEKWEEDCFFEPPASRKGREGQDPPLQ